VVAALSGQPSLLLLDNCEHLVTQAARVVQLLLERVPTVTVLTTSRQRLDVPGEREFLVPPLPVPNLVEPSAEADLPERAPAAVRLSRCASVQLFVDRAQAVRPDFQVTASNAAALADLCCRLEGIPLALELAAARVGVLTPAQILARLSQRFDLLARRGREPGARHASLRAAIDWSYHLLSPELQRFFPLLSVFRGGFTLEAAEAVCETAAALDALTELRECSLVLAEESGEEMRYGLLETLREYGAEQLTPEERAELARRHRDHFLQLGEQAEEELTGAAQGEWLERLETERENLRSALACCAERGEAKPGLRLSGSLARFWAVRGYLREGREYLTRLLALPGAEVCREARAKALNGAGILARLQSDYRAAR
jgi:predicted ATPase